MVFSGLAEKLQDTLQKLKTRGKLTEKDVEAALREVRLALLEADVNFKVVKTFISKVTERAIGAEVLKSLSPGQHVIKIVNEELSALMGGTQAKLQLAGATPAIILMVGLQGSGKTTSSGKLTRFLKADGKRPLLVAADVYRPAAIKQLQVVGEQIGIPVFAMGDKTNPVDIARGGIEHAKAHGNDVVVIDTAGRLHIDETLMGELEGIKKAMDPAEILLVVDAMTGQDAVSVAQTFDDRLAITGVVLTKLDGDARGGAALSVKSVTGKPIKFVGMGEKLDALEPFHPDRMASRILGMGDVLTLIEKAEASIDVDQAEKMAEKLRTADFTLEDFMDQLAQVKKMGPLDQVMGMIPGFSGAKQLKGLDVDDGHLKRIEAIVSSMTVTERRRPSIIDGSRRRRIAAGSGTKVQDVKRLLKQFDQVRQMMKQFGALQGGGKRARRQRRLLGNLFQ